MKSILCIGVWPPPHGSREICGGTEYLQSWRGGRFPDSSLLREAESGGVCI